MAPETTSAERTFGDRLFERFGWKLMPMSLWVSAIAAEITVVLLCAGVAVYFEATMREALIFVGVAFVDETIGLAIGFAIAWPKISRPLTAWQQAGRPAEDAPHVWQLVTDFAPKTAVICIPFTTLVQIIVLPTLAHFLWDAGWVTALLGATYMLVSSTAIFVFAILAGELVTRPMLIEIASRLPASWEPPPSRLSIRLKVGAALLGGLGSASLASASLAVPQPTLEAQSAQTLVIFAVVTAFLATPYLVIFAGNLFEPLGHLRRAAIRVGEGDFGTRVVVTTRDDFGQVASSFNKMTVALADKDADLRASRSRLVAVADAERRRMEQDLHDGAQQYLVLLRVRLGLFQKQVERGGSVPDLVSEMATVIDQALVELRNLAHGIYPVVLESSGLAAALREAAGRASLPTSVESDGVPRLSTTLETAIYFCCLEALQNAGKYAGADAVVTISVECDSTRVTFSVVDNGTGFDPSVVVGGFTNMKDRIGAVGGELVVTSTPGSGVQVRGWAPVVEA